MIERAVMQHAVGVNRDGSLRYEMARRPSHVEERAQRLMRWHYGGSEPCQRCLDGRAMVISSDVGLCFSCRSEIAQSRSELDITRPQWGEPRAEAAPERDVLRGYAIVFNKKSLDLGGFVEQVDPSAVQRMMAAKATVTVVYSHNAEKPLAIRGKGLSYRADDNGVRVEFVPGKTSYGADLTQNVGDGVMNKMSFGFMTVTDEWQMEDGKPLRTLLDMEVSEVSPVVWPAYPQTSLQVVRGENREAMTAARLRLASL